MLFHWKAEYGVGLLEIDQQHRLLINLINDLYMAIHENKTTEATADFLTRLKEYTWMHFATEKEIMGWLDKAGLAALEKKGGPIYRLDVRDPAEYAQGHLPGFRHAAGGQLVQATDRLAQGA